MARLRVRHPGADPHDIDLGPLAGAIRRSAREPRPGAPVGDMSPVLTVGGLTAMSPRNGATDQWADRGRYRRRAFSIHSENAKPLCGRVMKSGDPCGQIADHKDSCRTAKALAGRTWGKRRAA